VNKIKLWLILLLLPFVLNLTVSAYIAASNPRPDFIGYLSGSIAGVLIIYFWFWEIVKAASKGTIELLKIMGWGFLFKLILILVIVFVGRYFDQFNQLYFVFSFFVSVMSATVIEILYFNSLNLKKQ
jgi:hypothetical protein